MNHSINHNLKLVLASKSPRRQQLIKELGFPFRIVEVDVEEVYPDDLPINQIPEFLAELKANHFKNLLDYEILITADTVVMLENKILGKPVDKEEAQRVLLSLSGKTHKVITGVCLKSNQQQLTFSETTKVHFCNISQSEINYYIHNYEVLDKAGSYAIQDWIGKIAVQHIEGDFYNIVGLPMAKLYQNLKTFIT